VVSAPAEIDCAKLLLDKNKNRIKKGNNFFIECAKTFELNPKCITFFNLKSSLAQFFNTMMVIVIFFIHFFVLLINPFNIAS
jgi:hypothetical protein